LGLISVNAKRRQSHGNSVEPDGDYSLEPLTPPSDRLDRSTLASALRRGLKKPRGNLVDIMFAF
jgi:hypothetical protein